MPALLVSIVTPSLNGGKYIEENLKSIKQQSYKNIEHIIVDGGSTDNTYDLVSKHIGSYNLKWSSGHDLGMYDAINKGFDLAKGDILAWLNTDDMLLPWAVELVVKIMTKTKIKWITGIPGTWSKDGLLYNLPIELPYYSRNFIKKGYYHSKGVGFIQQESTFWTRELWENAGGISDIKIKYAGDFYLWKAFAEYEELYFVDTVFGGYRKHGEQKTAVIDDYLNEIADYIKVGWHIRAYVKLLRLLYGLKIYRPKNLIYTKDIISALELE